VWFAGCNMRCSYCYNIDIVKGKGKMSFEDVLSFLDTRVNLLDGVVLSGGECTIHPGLESFIQDIKQRNLLVKIDTNGSNPQVLERLIQSKAINYVALDFKAMPDRFYSISKSDLFNEFENSLEILIESTISFEVRTTFHSALFDMPAMQNMVSYLETKKYKGVYYIQNYFNNTPTLDNLDNDYKRFNPAILNSDSFEIVIRN
jgi:pyruvate formate lyase activating enzyme